MGMAGNVAEILVDAFVNATEDEDKVRAAISNIIGPQADVGSEVLEGSFGNPIIVLRARLKKKADVKPALERIVTSEFFVRSIEMMQDRLDDDLFYHLRLDKADAYVGVPRLWTGGESIDLRLKIVTYPRSHEEAVDILNGLVGGSGKGKID